MPPVDPIRNLQATPNATNPAGQDPLGHWQDRRGGGGAGGGGQGAKEEEAPSEGAEAETAPHLEGDALATSRGTWSGAGLDFGAAMPWEPSPSPPDRPKGKLGHRAPLGRGAKPAAAPAALPGGAAGTAPLGPPPVLGTGRRVEQVYDPTAAVTQTLSALREARPSPPPQGPPPAPALGAPPPAGIAKPLALLRQRAKAAPGPTLPPVDLEGLPEEVAAAMAKLAEEATSGWPAEGEAHPPHPAPERQPPSRRALGSPGSPAPGLHPRSGPGTVRLVAPQEGPRVGGEAEGPHPGPPPKAPGRSPGLEAPRPSLGPEAAEAPRPSAPEGAPAKEAPGARGAPAQGKPRPAAAEGPPPAPPLSPGAGALMVRVVDLRTNAGVGGARMELEPIENDRLPSFPGQADGQGWWVLPKVPPGLYRLTARHPGKVPSSRELVMQAGQLEDVGLVLSSP